MVEEDRTSDWIETSRAGTRVDPIGLVLVKDRDL